MHAARREPHRALQVSALEDLRRERVASHALPVGERRHLFAGKSEVRVRLVPADAGHRPVFLPVREGTGLPGRRARAARRIPEARHGLVPRHGPSALGERMRPELTTLVAAGVDEGLVLAVGHLVAIDPEIRELRDRRDRRQARDRTAVGGLGPAP